MKRQRIFILSVLLFSLIFSRPCFGFEDEDFGIWNRNDVQKQMGDKFNIAIGEELRYRESFGLFYFDTHLVTSYRFFKRLAGGFDYLQIRHTRAFKKKDIWYWESRPRIHLTPSIEICGFLLENRNMLEFRFKQDAQDTIRYRNYTSLTAPYQWTPLELQPYVGNEIFIESNRNGMTLDRFYSGFKLHYFGPFYGAIFYLREFSKNNAGSWKDQNFLGLNLRIAL